MRGNVLPRATLGRLPRYLSYIRTEVQEGFISAAAIARGLELGEVMVRKDLSLVCGLGRPKVGYETRVLTHALENALGVGKEEAAVLVGAGKLGKALLGYDGFRQYGLRVAAAFDADAAVSGALYHGNLIYSMDRLVPYCRENRIRIGIITVPPESAQQVADLLAEGGVTAIWSFAPTRLQVPEGISLQQEDLALSLAHLRVLAREREDFEEQ